MNDPIDKVEAIKHLDPLDLYRVREVLTSNNITRTEKIRFIETNHAEIKRLADEKISGVDFQIIMENRPLIPGRPLKNGYTRIGDKKILAIALGIKPINVDAYVKNLTLQIRSMQDLDALGISKDDYEKVKTYVYRNGTKSQVIDHLDYELSNTKNILQLLYQTLEYNTGGVADYFLYPIHRLDNNTMLKVYNTIDKNLKSSCSKGHITDIQALDTAEWALARIYEIQNNQHI